MKLTQLLKNYNLNHITIGTLGGHSALDICLGAKKAGFRTVAVCQKGRDKTYRQYYKTQGDEGIVDEIILVDKFTQLTSAPVSKALQHLNTIFIQSRYFWVYCDHHQIETNFPIPIFGTRGLVKLEERHVPKNQYYLMQQAGLKYPRLYSDPKQIDRLVIVKVAEAVRSYERAFFFAQSYPDYQQTSAQLLKQRLITPTGLSQAVIEEFVVGAPVNFNFFYSPLRHRVELMGVDLRRQTNLDGLLRLPSPQQHQILNYLQPQYLEVGHVAATVKESLLEKAFALAEKLVATTKKEFPPGIIGPFALQSAITPGPPQEDIITFDLSLRLPGSPGTAFTPYSSYLYRQPLSYGDRIALEISHALKLKKLGQILT